MPSHLPSTVLELDNLLMYKFDYHILEPFQKEKIRIIFYNK